jgi:hypothetical protein
VRSRLLFRASFRQTRHRLSLGPPNNAFPQLFFLLSHRHFPPMSVGCRSAGKALDLPKIFFSIYGTHLSTLQARSHISTQTDVIYGLSYQAALYESYKWMLYRGVVTIYFDLCGGKVAKAYSAIEHVVSQIKPRDSVSRQAGLWTLLQVTVCVLISTMSSGSGRKIGKRACDACKIRKIKCSETPPCNGCIAIGMPCTFKKHQATRGPRHLRAKTIRQIAEAQQESPEDGNSDQDQPSPRSPPSDGSERGLTEFSSRSQHLPRPHSSGTGQKTPIPSLVLRLCVYRLRLFPVWPIIAVEEIMSALHRDQEDLDSYALANAVGAATIAQLKLGPSDSNDPTTAATMEAECQRTRLVLQSRADGPPMNINWLRTSFFLHVYHENQTPGGAKSLLYLREAITVAQIMGLHREKVYSSLLPAEQQMRRRILWLLFVTER